MVRVPREFRVNANGKRIPQSQNLRSHASMAKANCCRFGVALKKMPGYSSILQRGTTWKLMLKSIRSRIAPCPGGSATGKWAWSAADPAYRVPAQISMNFSTSRHHWSAPRSMANHQLFFILPRDLPNRETKTFNDRILRTLDPSFTKRSPTGIVRAYTLLLLIRMNFHSVHYISIMDFSAFV